MGKYLVFVLILIALSCSRDDNGLFLWEKTSGEGVVYTSEVTSDSLFIFAGMIGSKPYVVKTNESGATIFSYAPDYDGYYTSLIEDASGFYLSGASGNDLVITKISKDGEELWNQQVSASADIMASTMLKISDGSFLAIAGDHPDSVRYNTYLMVYFDGEGNILETDEPAPGYKVSVNDAVTGPAGELYIGVTKITTGTKSKASVARINSEGLIIWERELYNNSSFSASTLKLDRWDDGSVIATGNTELLDNDDLLMNSWVVSIDQGGMVNWKTYLENSNTGEDLDLDLSGSLLVLNRNCGLINFISPDDGTRFDMHRIYDACDPYDTRAYLFTMKVVPSGNYILAGSKSGKFYYSLARAVIYEN